MFDLSKKRIAIISHVYSPGPAHELEAYLKDKVEELYFIAHPLDFVKDRPSIYKGYKKGQLIFEKKGRVWAWLGLGIYLKDMVANIWWGLTLPRLDLIIALDNINATSALWLRSLGRVRQVVFYTIDYVPQRFGNPQLNRFYHKLDSDAVRHSDYVWNLSPIMAQMREKKGVEKRFRDKQITVPIGTHILPIEKIKKDPNLIIFMGHLREGQGADLLIEAMPLVLKEKSDVKLRLIGGGPLEAKLRELAKELKVDTAIDFTGFVPTNEEMRKLLLEGTVAVAPYVDDDKTYTRYTDPGKPKEYLAAGLPVIITKVPAFAQTIHDREAGLAIGYDKKELASAITTLLSSKKINVFQQNASALAKESTWDKVFSDAFKQMEE